MVGETCRLSRRVQPATIEVIDSTRKITVANPEFGKELYINSSLELETSLMQAMV